MRYSINNGILVWDAETSILYDRSGAPICLSSLPESFSFIEYNKKEVNTKFDFSHLKLQLGFNCNLNCSYCSQRISRQHEHHVFDIERFCTILKNSIIDISNVETIELWGGEPFVYWKILPTLVDALRRLGFNGKFVIVTNVSIFSDEIADWCIENNVFVKFSHDGVNHKRQRSVLDWLDDDLIVKRVKRVQESSGGCVACVFSPLYNTDLFQSLELFRSRLGDTFPVLFDGAFWCDSESSYLMAGYTPESILSVSDSWFKILIESVTPDSQYFQQLRPTRTLFSTYIRRLVEGIPPASIVSRCETKTKNYPTFDLNGNYCPCHGLGANSGHSTGTLADLQTCVDLNAQHLSDRPFCADCPVSLICGGPCIFRSDSDALFYCKSSKWSFYTIFSAAIFVLLGIKITSIAPLTTD